MLRPDRMHLRFVNADVIAAQRWPDDAAEHSYDAAQLAAAQRAELIAAQTSFITQTVFPHPSKLSLLRAADLAGYRISLHVVLVPEDLAVARVAERVRRGGHTVPEDKIRSRYTRLWAYVQERSRPTASAAPSYVPNGQIGRRTSCVAALTEPRFLGSRS